MIPSRGQFVTTFEDQARGSVPDQAPCFEHAGWEMFKILDLAVRFLNLYGGGYHTILKY
jgi:hypothetical protein